MRVLLAVLLLALVPATARADVRAARPSAWTHQHAYALDPASPVVAQHPEWILKDAWGTPLWVGTSYAADFGNPDYRAWWIASVAGQRALWVDGVFMERRVAYSSGYPATPRDPRTNRSMSEANWQRYMADFMVALRAALPSADIVHDILWFKGDVATNVRRELDAADRVFLAGGFDDPTLVAGTGKYGWQTLAGFVERRQAAGRRVILGGDGPYALANALLVDGGALALAADGLTAPALGAPAGARRLDAGVWRRDYANGTVLVNEPGSPARTLTVDDETVTLAAASGAVLPRKPKPGPVIDETSATAPVSVAPPVPAGETPEPVTTKQGPAPVVAHTAGARGAKPTQTSVRLARTRVSGRVRGASGGTVRVTIERRRGGRWTTALRIGANVRRSGSFARDIPALRRGAYRVSARFLGTGTARPSRTPSALRSL